MNKKVVYLIRHAQSVYNIAEANIEHSFKPSQEEKTYLQSKEYFDLKFDLKYEDCGITEKGKQQCKECKQKMSQKDINLIIVSPLRRALDTCHEVFLNHKSKAPIIVDPAFREIMQSSCDIGSRLQQSMKDYPQMDFSLIDKPHMWYVEQLQHYADRQKIEQKIDKHAQKQDQAKQAKNATLEYLKEIWEGRKQDESLKKHVLPNISDQKNTLKELLLKYDSIAVVTHSENIKSYIGEKPKNCQIFQYLQEHFDKDVEEIEKKYL